MDGFVVRCILRKILPLAEIKGAKGAVFGVHDSLGVALKKQR